MKTNELSKNPDELLKMRELSGFSTLKQPNRGPSRDQLALLVRWKLKNSATKATTFVEIQPVVRDRGENCRRGRKIKSMNVTKLVWYAEEWDAAQKEARMKVDLAMYMKTSE